MKKTALITGGSSGLGFVFAEELGKQGYKIFILARDGEKLRKAVASLEEKGIEIRGISCNVSDESQLRTAYNTIKSGTDTLDFLILNAGMVIPQLLSDYPDTSGIHKQIDTN